MKVVIVGCGRVGAALAEAFDSTGNEVVVVDTSTRAFDRLSAEFKGQAVRGDGTDEDVLRRAGAEGADAFLALTEGDNRNVISAQVAQEKLGVARAIAKVNDPVRAAAYAELGIATVCRTTMMADAILGHVTGRPTGMPSVIPAVPHVHDDAAGEASGAPRLGAQPVANPAAGAEPDASGAARPGTTREA